MPPPGEPPPAGAGRPPPPPPPPPPAPPRRRSSPGRALLFPQAGEDHAPGRGLEHRGNRGADLLPDEPLAVVHHHHRPVVAGGNALADLLALLDDVDVHHLAGQHDRLWAGRRLRG